MGCWLTAMAAGEARTLVFHPVRRALVLHFHFSLATESHPLIPPSTTPPKRPTLPVRESRTRTQTDATKEEVNETEETKTVHTHKLPLHLGMLWLSVCVCVWYGGATYSCVARTCSFFVFLFVLRVLLFVIAHPVADFLPGSQGFCFLSSYHARPLWISFSSPPIPPLDLPVCARVCVCASSFFTVFSASDAVKHRNRKRHGIFT